MILDIFCWVKTTLPKSAESIKHHPSHFVAVTRTVGLLRGPGNCSAASGWLLKKMDLRCNVDQAESLWGDPFPPRISAVKVYTSPYTSRNLDAMSGRFKKQVRTLMALSPSNGKNTWEWDTQVHFKSSTTNGSQDPSKLSIFAIFASLLELSASS